MTPASGQGGRRPDFEREPEAAARRPLVARDGRCDGRRRSAEAQRTRCNLAGVLLVVAEPRRNGAVHDGDEHRENGEDWKRQRGEPFYDVGRLRSELGMDYWAK